jgi:hypothetical protein
MQVVRHAPVFAATRSVIESLVVDGRWPTLAELGRVAALRCEADQGPRRRRGLRPRAELYDAQIAERSVLPTRPENWHDLFNVVTWATFPLAKRALHARQFRRLAERVPEHFDKLPGARSEEQSALTQLDEGGMVVSLPASADEPPDSHAQRLEALLQALQSLAITRVPLDATHLAPFGASCRVFGHALHEHLALGGLTPRATLVVLSVPPAQLDAALADRLADDSRPFRCAPASAWVTRTLDTTG